MPSPTTRSPQPLPISTLEWRRALLAALVTSSLGAVPLAIAQSTASTHSSATSVANAYPIFVLNSLDASVSVINPVNGSEVKRIPVGKEPHHLYLTPDERSLLVANAAGNSLTFIDPKTAEVQRTVPNILDPYQLRFSPDMKWFVTLANRLNHADIYRWEPDNKEQPFRLLKRIPTAKTPSHLTIDSSSQTVYATMQDSHEVVAIDLKTQTIVWRVRTGKLPADIFLTPDDKTLFIALTGDRMVEAYDVSTPGPARLVKRIETGEAAHAFRALGDKRHLLVSNRSADTISILDTQTQTVVGKLPAPGGPDCMELMADGKTVLVTSRWARKLTWVDIPSRSVIHQVKVGKSPHGVFTLQHAPRQ